jgi:predicted dehydrogenase
MANMPDHGIDRASWTDHDSLEAEQAGFAAACAGTAPPEAGAREGIAALRVALAVERAIG